MFAGARILCSPFDFFATAVTDERTLFDFVILENRGEQTSDPKSLTSIAKIGKKVPIRNIRPTPDLIFLGRRCKLQRGIFLCSPIVISQPNMHAC
jgi:hypothetical protein